MVLLVREKQTVAVGWNQPALSIPWNSFTGYENSW